MKKIGINIKNTWKGIKFIISLKPAASSVPPSVFSVDNIDNTTNLYDTANTFYNDFASIAELPKTYYICINIVIISAAVQYFCSLLKNS